MKILIIDQLGLGLAFASRCARNGHKVRWFIKPCKSNNPNAGAGFKGIEKVDNWLQSVKWADLIWCSTNDDYIPKLEMIRKGGQNVFAPSKKSADLEIKRSTGLQLLEEYGIEVPEYKQFKTLKDAEEYVWKHDDRYVFKPLGDNEDKSLSYCSKSPADMIARLRRWQDLQMNPKGPVMLQKFIPGVEFAVSMWMGKYGFIGQPNENFEHKKLMAGDSGPNTGEMGTVMKYVKDSKLADEVLFPLEEALVDMGHLGDIDINVIVDEKGKSWPLEFTCRPGWPAFNIMMAAHKGDPAQWMLDACNGDDSLEVSPQVATGVVLSIPYFPYVNILSAQEDQLSTEGIPVYGVTEKNRQYISPQGIKMEKMVTMDNNKVVESDIWTSCGDYLAVVTALGKTVKQSNERAYKTVDEIHVPDMMFRNDIGKRLEKDLPELHKHGYAKEFTYK